MKTLFQKLASGILVMLGFSVIGCEIVGRQEYGTPTAVYNIKGKVTDASRQEKGIPDIRMVFTSGTPKNMWEDMQWYIRYYADTVYTASDGTYHYKNQRYFEMGGFNVILKDLNGNFKTDTVQVLFTSNEGKQVGSWVTKYSKNGVNFTLQPGQDPNSTNE